jgi:FMN phosphatase YigB (HAD superfamily)
MIKAVLFDLDNTLVNFMQMKKISCSAAIDAMIGSGLDVEHDRATEVLFDLYDKHGLEEKTIFQKFLKKVHGKVDYKILASGIVAYRRVRAGFLDPYPNVDYVLLKLKGMGLKIGIVTDAPRLKAWIRLASMKLSNYFDVVVTFEDTLRKLKLGPQECLMVGDWPERDMKGASAIGMKTCFAKYGNPKIKNSFADYEIDDIKMLLGIAKNLT